MAATYFTGVLSPSPSCLTIVSPSSSFKGFSCCLWRYPKNNKRDSTCSLKSSNTIGAVGGGNEFGNNLVRCMSTSTDPTIFGNAVMVLQTRDNNEISFKGHHMKIGSIQKGKLVFQDLPPIEDESFCPADESLCRIFDPRGFLAGCNERHLFLVSSSSSRLHLLSSLEGFGRWKTVEVPSECFSYFDPGCIVNISYSDNKNFLWRTYPSWTGKVGYSWGIWVYEVEKDVWKVVRGPGKDAIPWDGPKIDCVRNCYMPWIHTNNFQKGVINQNKGFCFWRCMSVEGSETI